jgi:hypothetical protein
MNKQYILPVVCVLVVLCIISTVIAEYCVKHTFSSTVASKHTEITYSFDSERMVTNVDSEGNVTVSSEGDDRTTATITYFIMAYDNSSGPKKIVVDRFSGSVPRCNDSEGALSVLMAGHVPPADYDCARIGEEYMFTVSGWIMTCTLVELTHWTLVKVEVN